jgi:hypothetical protein
LVELLKVRKGLRDILEIRNYIPGFSGGFLYAVTSKNNVCTVCTDFEKCFFSTRTVDNFSSIEDGYGNIVGKIIKLSEGEHHDSGGANPMYDFGIYNYNACVVISWSVFKAK